MTTVTWGGRNGSWSFPTHWRPLVTPGSLDVAVFGRADTSTATVDGPATIGSVTLEAGSRATIQVQDTLTVLGTFRAEGGTVELDQGGTIAGGTVDLTDAAVVPLGGVIDGSVWIGDLGRGVIVTAATLAATEAARGGQALTVAGTLGLVGGTYDDLVLSLDGFGRGQGDELDVTNGDLVLFGAHARVVLSQDDPSQMPGSNPAGATPVLGGVGTIGNDGLIISDAPVAEITAQSFVNAGSIVLNDAIVAGEAEYFIAAGLLTWTATLAPTLSLANTQFENDGTITGAGATLDVTGGGFVNTGLIALGEATAQGPILQPTPHVGAMQLLSTLDIGADVAGFSNSGTLSADTIELEGLVSLDSLGVLLGTVLFTGTLDLGGGTLDASTLDASTRYVVTGTILDGTVLDANGRIDTSAATLDQVTLQYTPSATLDDVLGPGTVVLGQATSELSYAAAETVHGLTVRAGAVGLQDRIAVRGGSVTFASNTLISDAVPGTSLAIGGGGTFVEDGRMTLDGSDMEVATLDGSGTITLADNAELAIDSIAPTARLTIVFGGSADALILPGNASGLGRLGITVTGLARGDLLDFSGVSSDPGTVFAQSGAAISNGLLQVQGASGDQASIAATGAGLTFNTGTDPNGGTIVTVACFRHGTLIATPGGERPVQRLRIGDPVLTHRGQVRRIKWLGVRAYPGALVRQQRQLRPVRVAAGALGHGLPRRALYVSPLHAMLLDGVLVPVAALVNGFSIARAPIADIAYVHVELDTPDIILAEGAATESFVDCNNRDMFDNAAEFAALYPGDTPRPWQFPVPRVEEGWALEAIRHRLAGKPRPLARPGDIRGHIDILSPHRVEGWAVDADDPARSIEFELVASGRQLGCLIANRYRIEQDRAGHGHGTCGFTADLPGLDAAALASVALVRLQDGARLTVI